MDMRSTSLDPTDDTRKSYPLKKTKGCQPRARELTFWCKILTINMSEKYQKRRKLDAVLLTCQIGLRVFGKRKMTRVILGRPCHFIFLVIMQKYTFLCLRALNHIKTFLAGMAGLWAWRFCFLSPFPV